MGLRKNRLRLRTRLSYTAVLGYTGVQATDGFGIAVDGRPRRRGRYLCDVGGTKCSGRGVPAKGAAPDDP